MIGVNKFASAAESLEVFTVDPAVEATQVAALRLLRSRRDQPAVAAALAGVADAARGGDNVIPACTAAVRAYATLGEIVAELRAVYGGWRPTGTF